jgi:hypothetical protein
MITLPEPPYRIQLYKRGQFIGTVEIGYIGISLYFLWTGATYRLTAGNLGALMFMGIWEKDEP